MRDDHEKGRDRMHTCRTLVLPSIFAILTTVLSQRALADVPIRKLTSHDKEFVRIKTALDAYCLSRKRFADTSLSDSCYNAIARIDGEEIELAADSSGRLYASTSFYIGGKVFVDVTFEIKRMAWKVKKYHTYTHYCENSDEECIRRDGPTIIERK